MSQTIFGRWFCNMHLGTQNRHTEWNLTEFKLLIILNPILSQLYKCTPCSKYAAVAVYFYLKKCFRSFLPALNFRLMCFDWSAEWKLLKITFAHHETPSILYLMCDYGCACEMFSYNLLFSMDHINSSATWALNCRTTARSKLESQIEMLCTSYLNGNPFNSNQCIDWMHRNYFAFLAMHLNKDRAVIFEHRNASVAATVSLKTHWYLGGFLFINSRAPFQYS